MVLITHDEEYYKQRKPQPDLGAIKNFKRFIWDPERRAFLDRTAREWMNVGVFYLCFYSVLFSLFALHMWLTYRSVAGLDKPKYQRDRASSGRAWLEPSRWNTAASLDRHGPGFSVKPNVLKEGHSARILIDKSTDAGKPQKYVNAIKKLLAPYEIDKSNFDQSCSDRGKRDEKAGKPCFFDITTLGECSQAPFGYTLDSPKPCVYITFNKRYGWLPIYYSQASILPHDMPDWLQKIIHQSNQFYVWLSCEGKSSEDKAKLGEIEYLPKPGFPVHFFPFNGLEHYVSPMVALRFNNLPVNHQVTVVCKAWARNIDNEHRYNLSFKIMIKK